MDVCHLGKLILSYRLNHITASHNVRKTLIVKCSKIVNEFKSSHEVCLVHVKCTCQHVYIELSVKVAIHKDVLVILWSNSGYALSVVILAHKCELIRNAPK